jgi:hypothetical protein
MDPGFSSINIEPFCVGFGIFVEDGGRGMARCG